MCYILKSFNLWKNNQKIKSWDKYVLYRPSSTSIRPDSFWSIGKRRMTSFGVGHRRLSLYYAARIRRTDLKHLFTFVNKQLQISQTMVSITTLFLTRVSPVAWGYKYGISDNNSSIVTVFNTRNICQSKIFFVPIKISKEFLSLRAEYTQKKI